MKVETSILLGLSSKTINNEYNILQIQSSELNILADIHLKNHTIYHIIFPFICKYDTVSMSLASYN